MEEVFEVLDSFRKPLNQKQRASMRGPYPYYGANGLVDRISEWIFDEPLLVAEDGGYFTNLARDRLLISRGQELGHQLAHVLRARWVNLRWFYSLVHGDIRPQAFRELAQT
jgi:type I restriction enzyme S subunit